MFTAHTQEMSNPEGEMQSRKHGKEAKLAFGESEEGVFSILRLLGKSIVLFPHALGDGRFEVV